VEGKEVGKRSMWGVHLNGRCGWASAAYLGDLAQACPGSDGDVTACRTRRQRRTTSTFTSRSRTKWRTWCRLRRDLCRL